MKAGLAISKEKAMPGKDKPERGADLGVRTVQNKYNESEVMKIIVTSGFLQIVKRIILLYDFVSDILKHKENRVKLQFAFCTVSFIYGSQLELTKERCESSFDYTARNT